MAAGGRFKSKWDLSLARAVAVAKALEEGGFDRQIVACGMADSRFEDIEADLGRTVRMNLARRVDVVVQNRVDAELGGYGSR